MKIPRMAKAVEHIDDDLVNAAAENTKITKNNIWLRWGALAACFMLVISGTLVMLEAYEEHTPPVIKDTNVSADDLIHFEDLGRNYKGTIDNILKLERT